MKVYPLLVVAYGGWVKGVEEEEGVKVVGYGGWVNGQVVAYGGWVKGVEEEEGVKVVGYGGWVKEVEEESVKVVGYGGWAKEVEEEEGMNVIGYGGWVKEVEEEEGMKVIGYGGRVEVEEEEGMKVIGYGGWVKKVEEEEGMKLIGYGGWVKEVEEEEASRATANAAAREQAATAARAAAMTSSTASSAALSGTNGMSVGMPTSSTSSSGTSGSTGSRGSFSQMAGSQFSPMTARERELREIQQVERLRQQLEEDLKKATDREKEIKSRAARLDTLEADKAALEMDFMQSTLDQILDALTKPRFRPPAQSSLPLTAMSGPFAVQAGTQPSGTSAAAAQTVASSSSGPVVIATSPQQPVQQSGQQQDVSEALGDLEGEWSNKDPRESWVALKKGPRGEHFVVEVDVGGRKCGAFIDTGSTRNYISRDCLERLHLQDQVRHLSRPVASTLANKERMIVTDYLKDVVCTFSYGGGELNHKISFLVSNDLPFDMLLGMYYLDIAKPQFDWDKKVLKQKLPDGRTVRMTKFKANSIIDTYGCLCASAFNNYYKQNQEEGLSVSMDFMDTLVTSKSGKRQIFVIIDRFTKYARLIPMPETARTEYVIKLFKDNWVRDFGLPKTIISDRDVRFTSELWKKTAEQMGSQLQMTSGNHPEANGQAEQMNRVVQLLLRHYIKPSQDDWDEQLLLIASLYNNAIHSSTGISPNQLHLGWKPRSALDFLLPENRPAATPGTLEYGVQYEKLLREAVEHMKKAQQAMIASENQHRRQSTFQVGERVWVKATPKFDGQEIFCDSTKTNPISWFRKFELTLQLHYVKEHKHHAYLYSRSGGACQAWLDNLLSKYGVVAGNLRTKISWDDLKAVWHKRFQVELPEIKAMDKLMVFEQGTLPSTNWIAGYQRLTSVPDIQMGFKAIRHYFISRSCPTLRNALTHVEDTLTTTVELFDKAAQIIITNKETKNLRSFAPGPSRDQHRPRVAVVAAATPFDQTSEVVSANEGDRLAAAREGGCPGKGRGRGKKTHTASSPGPGAAAPAPWSQYGISEQAFKRFIEGYSKIAAHLTKLQCEDRPFDFGEEARESFLALKAALLSAEVLRIYDPLLPKRITTDASGYGIGAVLEQHDGVDWHPVEYFSKKVVVVHSIDDARKEFLVFVHALKRWRHFLLGRSQFRWVTNNNPLVFYKTQDTVNSTIARWMASIDQFDFFPDHIPEKSNRFADALSQLPNHCTAVYSNFEIDDDLRNSFIRGYQADPEFHDKYANACLSTHGGRTFFAHRVILTCVHGFLASSSMLPPPDTLESIARLADFASNFGGPSFSATSHTIASHARFPDAANPATTKDWVERLPDVELAYNSSIRPTIGISPFEFEHSSPVTSPLDTITPRTAESDDHLLFLRRMQELLVKARDQMAKTQQRMSQQANRQRLPCPFRAGDLVWVFAAEFSLEQDISRKLLPKWMGPWPIVATAGDAPEGPSFTIQVPAHLPIYPVFHCSKLALYTPAEHDDFLGRRSQDPPSMGGFQEVGDIISQRRYGNRPTEYLVHFAYCTHRADRWLTRAELQATAPNVLARYERKMQGKPVSSAPRRTRIQVPPSDRRLRPRPGLTS
ncbi:hypothetical protein CBR_g42174 [Chara braunii]|uniref:Integrase catalytic domain-containing protein n=1 Tax=Chara braunii TaxID=69332 RepID=A0A388LX36_CHABU|nr:hypothetical protein CBR_g42174 [Chara braunii]|eukprot:GBG86890.1 hypothetical protein CBR_g42174 [Chara braunii]